jgi:hypothetical protein
MNCNKMKKEEGEYIYFQEMSGDEKKEYEKLKKTIRLNEFIREHHGDVAKIENFLDANPELIDSYQKILTGDEPRISHGMCPECFQEEISKYQKPKKTAAKSSKKNKKPYIIYKKHRTWPDSEKKYVAWGWATSSDNAKAAFMRDNGVAFDQLAVGYEFSAELDTDRIQSIKDRENAEKAKQKHKEENIEEGVYWWQKD